ncbi:MAG: hypothetical protein ABEJ71_00055, partial [Halodesulfurarchaeum sp.]
EEIVRAAKSARHDYECAECGSPWGIEQDGTLVEHRLDNEDVDGEDDGAEGATKEDADDESTRLRGRWRDARSAASINGEGESGSFERRPGWRLEAVIDGEGEEHRPTGDGVEMKPLILDREPPPEAQQRTLSGDTEYAVEYEPPQSQRVRREAVLEAAEEGSTREALLSIPEVRERDVEALLENGKLYRAGGGEIRAT